MQDNDFNKYSIHTDIALELIEDEENIKGIKINKKKVNDILVTNVIINKEGSIKINKKPGKYITIEFKELDDNNKKIITTLLSEELQKILNIKNKNEHILIVGLGNESSTPDSLGPITINHINVTNHLYELGVADGEQRVSAFNPNVMGKTGIETSDLLLNLVKLLKPDYIIVIDSLASSSIERVNKTIQMTDTGIHPGSGIGNKRKEISEEIFGIPVIAIGVPTVVDAVTIVADTFKFLTKHYIYMKKNIDNPKLKLMTNINYLDEEIIVSDDDKKKLLGLIGSLSESEVKTLMEDVLSPIGYNLMVTPKEIDYIVKEISILIADALNKIIKNA